MKTEAKITIKLPKRYPSLCPNPYLKERGNPYSATKGDLKNLKDHQKPLQPFEKHYDRLSPTPQEIPGTNPPTKGDLTEFFLEQHQATRKAKKHHG